MQSRFLLWFDCHRIGDKKISIRKQLVIPSEGLDTFITFEVQRIGGTLIGIELDEDSKKIVRHRDLKCKCIVYDAVSRSTAKSMDDDSLEEGYFGTLVDVTLLKSPDALSHSKVDIREDLVHDACSDKANIEMEDDILMLIPMNRGFSKSLKSSSMKTEHDFKTNPYYFSSNCGNYIFSKEFYRFLSGSDMFCVSLVYKRKQYWFKNFSDTFQLSHSPKQESTGESFFMLGVYIGSSIEEKRCQRQRAMEVLQRNNINFVERSREDLLVKDLFKAKNPTKPVKSSEKCQKLADCRFNLDKNNYILCYE